MRGGISHDRLSKEVYPDPKNLGSYIKELIKEGLVKKDKGLQGKYFPTEEAYKDQLLNAYLFADNFRRNILRKSELLDDGYKIENIRPSEFNTNAKINSLEVILISYQGEKRSVKG